MDEKDNKNLKGDEISEEPKDGQKPYEEEYSFMKEIIKRKPIDKRRVMLRMISIAGAAILFGIISAVVFARIEPIAQKHFAGKEKPPKVDITTEDDADDLAEADNAGEDPTTGEESQTPSPDVTQIPVQPEITLDDYKKLYADLLKVTEEPKKSIVTVIGLKSQVDLLNQTYESSSQLSGLIVANNGQDLFILTEYRVVENVDRIQVTFCDGSTMDARFQKTDGNTGLSILKVPLSEMEQGVLDKIQAAPLGSSYSVKQGEPIIAIGSPMGYSDSVAYGVVTSVTNQITTFDTEYNLLTTDILGSSGGSGVLLNLDGEVVGIIAQSYSLESSKNIVTGLAISPLKQLIEILSNNTDIIYVGIKGQEVTADISTSTGIPKGVYVEQVAGDSPAMQVGIQNGDVIIGINEEPIETIKQYHDQLTKYKPGEVIKVKAMRQGTEGFVEMLFEVTVAAS